MNFATDNQLINITEKEKEILANISKEWVDMRLQLQNNQENIENELKERTTALKDHIQMQTMRNKCLQDIFTKIRSLENGNHNTYDEDEYKALCAQKNTMLNLMEILKSKEELETLSKLEHNLQNAIHKLPPNIKMEHINYDKVDLAENCMDCMSCSICQDHSLDIHLAREQLEKKRKLNSDVKTSKYDRMMTALAKTTHQKSLKTYQIQFCQSFLHPSELDKLDAGTYILSELSIQLTKLDDQINIAKKNESSQNHDRLIEYLQNDVDLEEDQKRHQQTETEIILMLESTVKHYKESLDSLKYPGKESTVLIICDQIAPVLQKDIKMLTSLVKRTVEFRTEAKINVSIEQMIHPNVLISI